MQNGLLLFLDAHLYTHGAGQLFAERIRLTGSGRQGKCRTGHCPDALLVHGFKCAFRHRDLKPPGFARLQPDPCKAAEAVIGHCPR